MEPCGQGLRVSQRYENDFFKCRKGVISVYKIDLGRRAMEGWKCQHSEVRAVVYRLTRAYCTYKHPSAAPNNGKRFVAVCSREEGRRARHATGDRMSA